MAKKGKTTQVQKKKPRAARKSRQVSVTPQMRYAQLLKHPDSGLLPDTGVYDGELGNFRRFVSTITLNNTAGHTAGVLAFCPGTGNGYSAGTATSSGVFSFAFTNAGYPGAVYLNANAAKVRGIAAKLEMIPSAASITTITGECSAGVTPSIFPSGSVTVDQIFDAAKAYGPLERKVVSSRWMPGGLDHVYDVYNVGPSEDRNMVWIAYRGWPAGVPLSIRITYVVEYTVKVNMGIPPTGAVSSPVGHAQVITALQSQDPHWHHTVLDDVKDVGRSMVGDLGRFARAGLNAGLHQLGTSMFKQAPKLLLTAL